MSLRALLSRVFTLLFPATLTVSLYLYLYPLINGCGFPLPHGTDPSNSSDSTILNTLQRNVAVNTFLQHVRTSNAVVDHQPAIFRLLVLADPQLEGDSSLPLPEWKLLPRLRTHWRATRDAISEASSTRPIHQIPTDANVLNNITTGIKTFLTEDVPRSFRATVKQVDLVGNDYYLAHMYRTLFWWTRPTHTTVLGDLLGSQWIDNDEFARRSKRYWQRVFRGAQRVEDRITLAGTKDGDRRPDAHPGLEPLGPGADPAWPRRIINVAGNHDIGYAGDASEARIERFEREFGRADWDIRFQHPSVNGPDGSVVTPTLHLINLNTLLFDTPALSQDLQSRSYSYLNDLISHRSYPVEDRSTFTLLLTHLPMHKQEGICTDGPLFTFHDEDDSKGPEDVPRWKAGGLREQNHLSDHISATGILQGIFGLSGDQAAAYGGYGRNGLILTGHDHTGCDVIHYVSRTTAAAANSAADAPSDTSSPPNWQWSAKRYNRYRPEKPASPSIREVTMRAMMGEFGGNAGLLSAWFDTNAGEWKYEISMCPAGVQHFWWAVHVLILVTLIVGLLVIITKVQENGGLAVMTPIKSDVSQYHSEKHDEKTSRGRTMNRFIG
ncbi:Uncharacterized protein PECH_006022 [Penicillium ucsense]|uniref:Calcineurin-like phosphoesterase domain-containing protein n=1 Tax=Penicillium ucsense TaxID=2839758 RepID=A0A8J8W0E0_9EURO|nr:Uncharacterized protein PECM_007473 [Penicillium ucsense]KAF7735879.1 Uncharacterized protein PECH_006022 [Penicillium ucsense]